MSDEFEMPDIMDVSPEAAAAAEASLDPDVKVPVKARKDVDKKTQDEYFRWTDSLVIEKAQRGKTTSGLTEFFIQAKIRPDGDPENKNIGKRVFSRYRVNFKVLRGQEKSPGHEIMNRLALAAIISLLKATSFAPQDASATGLKAALLTHLFPAEVEPHESPLVGKVAVGNICDKPNKGQNARKPRQTEVETWLPPVEEQE
jgi:hypothetical protein